MVSLEERTCVIVIGLLFSFCIVVLSQAPILVRFAESSSLAICFWRLLMAAGILAPFLIRGRRYQEFFRLSKRTYFQLGLSGFFLFIHFYFFFRSVQETSVANASILFCLNPVTTAVGAYLIFREKVTLHLVAACTLGILGVVALLGESAVNPIAHMQGDVWGVLSAACFSGYILTGKSVRKKLNNTVFATCIYLQTAMYAGIAMYLLGEPFVGYSTQTWWAFLLMAIFPTLLGHMIFTYCLNFMNVNLMSCATLVEPVLAAIVAAWLFNEKLTGLGMIGFTLTSASVIVLYWSSVRGLLLRMKVRL